MSKEHKRLLRRAAEYLADLECAPYSLGMCCALRRSTEDYGSVYHQCGWFVKQLYLRDSPYSHSAYWMGPEIDPKNRQHRIMALLFAAECFDDMEGL